MNRALLTARIDAAIARFIDQRLAETPLPEEAEWVADLLQRVGAMDDAVWAYNEARRLFWEAKTGLDAKWPKPTRADFDSDDAWSEFQALLLAGD